MARKLAIAALVAARLLAQDLYKGPYPPKPNLPYIVHADNLIETESKTAHEQTTKNATIYTVDGDKSTARTPLANPTLVIDATTLDAEKLALFRFDIKNGHREVTLRQDGKGGSVPLHIETTKVSGHLYQIRVVDSLANGEYGLSPDGSNDAFCFEVF